MNSSNTPDSNQVGIIVDDDTIKSKIPHNWWVSFCFGLSPLLRTILSKRLIIAISLVISISGFDWSEFYKFIIDLVNAINAT